MQLPTFFVLGLAAAAAALPQPHRRPEHQSQVGPASTIVPGVAPMSTAAPTTTPTNITGNANFDALVPQFGIKAGQQPDGTGNCAGLNGKLIPCSCPPDRTTFIQKVQQAAAAGSIQGTKVAFPIDQSKASQKARIGASIIVLQNLHGRGVGCPAASTTFVQQEAAL